MFFKEIKKPLGFGFMRLPQKDGEIDYDTCCAMVDLFLENGFNYFDTAHGYHGGKSEVAIRKCLTSRYPRERYVLANKLSPDFFGKEEDIRPLFAEQLAICGVEYFDFYLMHAQSRRSFAKYKACRAYETALALKEEGKIRHLAISFHDKAAVLDEILTEYPQIEAVQLQFNYADYDDPSVESRKCYETCRRHGKPVIVMEPVKGGRLANLPEEAAEVLRKAGEGSPASFAIRFAAGFEGVTAVLSGMSSPEQLRDNVSFMKDFHPLNERETAALREVCKILEKLHTVPCTACRYCTDGCPAGIPIPDLFSCLNAKKTFRPGDHAETYRALTAQKGKASDCLGCGKCEAACPQHLEIRGLLKEVAAEFEG